MQIERILRKSLLTILRSGIKVQRFTGDDLPKGVVIDNVYLHTLRLFSMAWNLPLSESIRDKVVETVLIHDLPEIFTVLMQGGDSDTTAIQKEADLQLEEKVANRKMRAARILFDRRELELYQEFEKAWRLFRGEAEEAVPSTASVLAALVDTIDANLTLHRSLSCWASSSDYNPDKIHPDRSLTFAFRHFQLTSKILSRRANEPAKTVGTSILNYQMQIIRCLWRLPQSRGVILPTSLLKELDARKELVNTTTGDRLFCIQID